VDGPPPASNRAPTLAEGAGLPFASLRIAPHEEQPAWVLVMDLQQRAMPQSFPFPAQVPRAPELWVDLTTSCMAPAAPRRFDPASVSRCPVAFHRSPQGRPSKHARDIVVAIPTAGPRRRRDPGRPTAPRGAYEKKRETPAIALARGRLIDPPIPGMKAVLTREQKPM